MSVRRLPQVRERYFLSLLLGRLRSAVPGGEQRDVYLSIALIAVNLLIFSLAKDVIRSKPYLPVLIGATAISVGFLFLRHSEIGKGISLTVRALSLTCTLYVMFSQPFFMENSAAGEENHATFVTLTDFYYAVIAFGAISVFRPSASFLPFVYLVVFKRALAGTSGIGLSQTDYAIIPETGIFVVISISTFGLLCRVPNAYHLLARSRTQAISVLTQRLRWLGNVGFVKPSSATYFSSLLLAVIAIHFANYFYAGHAKLALQGPLLAWLGNKTYNIFYSSLLYEANPLMATGWPLRLLEFFLVNANLLANALVLIFQLFCIVALFRRRLIVLSIAFFDLMHVMIFLASGIFFWKWIIFNSILIFAIGSMKWTAPPRQLVAAGILLCLLAPTIFYIPRLGWFDSREVNMTYFQAVLDDGRRVRLPSNFFRNYSITFAQHRVARAAADRAPTGAFGVAYSYDVYSKSFDCANELVPGDEGARSQRELDNFIRLVRGYHAFALELADENGSLNYDLFPHHIWTNPWMFEEAATLDLRRVAAYELVIEAVCVREPLSAGLPSRDTRARTVFPISLLQEVAGAPS